ncbi:MAG TPA: cell wall hydrolase [Alphaproteobacteria bacterium]|nr:cell wall hydrolase [Alphaproteobacteria bacterium]
MTTSTTGVAPDALDTLARTLWGEARGEGREGMEAVAAVIANRIDISLAHGGRYWWGRDWISVCRAKAQFSCWNPGDPNRAKLLAVDDSDPSFRLAKEVAADAMADRIADPTFRATSYKVASLPWPYAWGHFRLPLIEIGRHAFYDLTRDP